MFSDVYGAVTRLIAGIPGWTARDWIRRGLWSTLLIAIVAGMTVPVIEKRHQEQVRAERAMAVEYWGYKSCRTLGEGAGEGNGSADLDFKLFSAHCAGKAAWNRDQEICNAWNAAYVRGTTLPAAGDAYTCL